MTWLDELLAWIRSLGPEDSVVGSLVLAFAALAAFALFHVLATRRLVPAFFRFAREESGAPGAAKVRLALSFLLVLIAPAVYLIDRNLVVRWYAEPIVGLVVLLSVYVLTELAILLTVGILARSGLPCPVLFRDIVRIVVYVTAGLAVLHSVFGIRDMGTLVGASAFFSIIIGLAVQDSLGNVFAGVFLQVDRPIKVGDWILVNGVEGRVAEVNWRAMRIVTWTNDSVSIPNNTIARADIVNFSAPTPLHVMTCKLGVSYAAQPNRVKRVLTEMLLKLDRVLKHPAPEVYILAYGDFSIEYELRYWIQDYGEMRRISDEVMTGVWYQFRRHGITIPFPIRDVVLHRARREEGAPVPEVLGLLRKIDFLAPVSDEELRVLADDFTHHLYAKGERVFFQGDEGHVLYVIWRGSVSVVLLGETGAEVQLAVLARGDFFGEMSLLTGEPRNAAVVAREDTDLLELDRTSFSRLLRDNPAIAQAMSDILARRMASTRARMSEAADTATRAAAVPADEVLSLSQKILTGIRGIFRFGGS